MLTRTWSLIVMAAICTIHILVVESGYEGDEIKQLPGQPNVDFRQFAGYISVNKERLNSLFYYFVEAETDPASKPLVLWLDGGPICSSVALGAFGATGPFRPTGNVLVKNDYSWNKEANMLYLDSPSGVGFSYSLNKSSYASVNEEIAAKDNLLFLRNWFDKFPEYKNRDFFIAGTSEAGYTVPQLANLIVHSSMRCILKGIILGNPLLDLNFDLNSKGEFLWSHGLISDSTFELVNDVCNFSRMYKEFFGSHSVTPDCSRVKKQIDSEITVSYQLFNGIVSDICLSPRDEPAQPQYGRGHGMENTDACITSETVEYLKRKDVQNAFHVQPVGAANWSICNSKINLYTYEDEERPRTTTVGSLVKTGVRVMVYSGDQGAFIPLTSTRKLVNELAKDMNMNTTGSYRAWFEGGQVGGWTQVYGDNLSFATIRGAGTNAARTQPERYLVLFTSFLNGEPLPDKKTKTT